ncbi:VWA domain-containing protein [Kiloniella laminariae]|uniref:VWA domain-containing protein n=1 Tax=Kiloniella laminariae TaxID=454162 RepID=A0ABT4LGS4_9PROT|nr:VWA domain-containing protein [Kiloniella laminariae]MCZ4280300.1 VWA domain-containing protein [Kiloniella laminariae]
MSIMELIEVEEFVGRQWHKFIAGAESYENFPEQVVELEEVRGALSVFFRALGGENAVEIAAAGQEKSGHRLSFRQKLGMDVEKMQRATLDGRTLMLPEMIAFFPDVKTNRDLYFWLAAFFTVKAPAEPIRERDLLRHDLCFIRQSWITSRELLEHLKGLVPVYLDLSAFLLRLRPLRNQLPAQEQAVEAVIRYLLGERCDLPVLAEEYLAFVLSPETPAFNDTGKSNFIASASYKPFLPVPLWGEMIEGAFTTEAAGSEAGDGGKSKKAEDRRKRRAERKELDQTKRNDGFFVNVYDKLMAVTDIINVNRNIKEDDEDSALETADDLDRITLTDHEEKAATKIKIDLDLPANELDESRVETKRAVKEWHYRKQAYLPDYCAVTMREADEDGGDWKIDTLTARRIRLVRRQFEAFRNNRLQLRGQAEGNELDLEALVRARGDLQASGSCSDRFYINSRKIDRDIAVSILMDVSLSTDSWLDERRVIDVEKESLAILANGLDAAGDDLSIHTFTSRKRHYVRIDRVKGFDEALNDQVMRRISALKPGYYTRIGAAIRVMAEELEKRPNRQKLLLILTDGKPNDVDHYEGRYGIEDARKAVQECRRKGITVFGVTIDQEAKDYFPIVFGRGAYHIVGNVARLSQALPKIYRQLVKESS